MTLNMNNGRARFSKLKTLINEIIFLKNVSNQQSSKIKIEPSQWEENCANANRTNNCINFVLKNDIGKYKTCWTVPLCSCFLFWWNWSCFTLHKIIPLKWWKCPPLLISCLVFRGTRLSEPFLYFFLQNCFGDIFH